MSITIERPEQFARALSQQYGSEWITWSPEVVLETLLRKYDYDPSTSEQHKIEALRTLLRGSVGLEEPLVFEKIIRSLLGLPISFTAFEPVNSYELLGGLYFIRKILGADTIKGLMDQKVAAYIATVLYEDNIYYPANSFLFDVADKPLRRLTGLTLDKREKMGVLWGEISAEPLPSDALQFAKRAKRILDKKGIEEGSITYATMASLSSIPAYNVGLVSNYKDLFIT